MTETRAPYYIRSSSGVEPAVRKERSQIGAYHLRADPALAMAVADFPGCKPVRISRAEIDSWEGRFEYWDAHTEIAMVAEPTTTYHEYPSQRLVRLTTIIALVRGSPIDTVGTADLLLRDASGDKERILQADQTVYLHPQRDRPPGASMEVGQRLPDVVLEVDHTTDVYRKKIEFYEQWGFPELWVDVPVAESASRPKRKIAGLRIHVRGAAGRYEERTESTAFPGWTATEIHRALNEEELSAETTATLRRIGQALGEREGTGPDDSLFLRAERTESRQQGYAEGRDEGHNEGQRAMLDALVATRFDTETAKSLRPLLADIDDAALRTRVAKHLMEGAALADLIDLLTKT